MTSSITMPAHEQQTLGPGTTALQMTQADSQGQLGSQAGGSDACAAAQGWGSGTQKDESAKRPRPEELDGHRLVKQRQTNSASPEPRSGNEAADQKEAAVSKPRGMDGTIPLSGAPQMAQQQHYQSQPQHPHQQHQANGDGRDMGQASDTGSRPISEPELKQAYCNSVQALKDYITVSNLLSYDILGKNLPDKVTRDLKMLIHQISKVCLQAIKPETPFVINVISKDYSQATTNDWDFDNNHWVNVVTHLQLTDAQVVAILRARGAHVEKLMALYQERAMIARQVQDLAAASCTSGSARAGVAEDHSMMGVLMRHGYLYCVRAMLSMHKRLELLKESLAREQRLVMELFLKVVYQVLSPVQAALFVVESFPYHCDVLALANVLSMLWGNRPEPQPAHPQTLDLSLPGGSMTMNNGMGAMMGMGSDGLARNSSGIKSGFGSSGMGSLSMQLPSTPTGASGPITVKQAPMQMHHGMVARGSSFGMSGMGGLPGDSMRRTDSGFMSLPGMGQQQPGLMPMNSGMMQDAMQGGGGPGSARANTGRSGSGLQLRSDGMGPMRPGLPGMDLGSQQQLHGMGSLPLPNSMAQLQGMHSLQMQGSLGQPLQLGGSGQQMTGGLLSQQLSGGSQQMQGILAQQLSGMQGMNQHTGNMNQHAGNMPGQLLQSYGSQKVSSPLGAMSQGGPPSMAPSGRTGSLMQGMNSGPGPSRLSQQNSGLSNLGSRMQGTQPSTPPALMGEFDPLQPVGLHSQSLSGAGLILDAPDINTKGIKLDGPGGWLSPLEGDSMPGGEMVKGDMMSPMNGSNGHSDAATSAVFPSSPNLGRALGHKSMHGSASGLDATCSALAQKGSASPGRASTGSGEDGAAALPTSLSNGGLLQTDLSFQSDGLLSGLSADLAQAYKSFADGRQSPGPLSGTMGTAVELNNAPLELPGPFSMNMRASSGMDMSSGLNSLQPGLAVPPMSKAPSDLMQVQPSGYNMGSPSLTGPQGAGSSHGGGGSASTYPPGGMWTGSRQAVPGRHSSSGVSHGSKQVTVPVPPPAPSITVPGGRLGSGAGALPVINVPQGPLPPCEPV